MRLEWLVLAAVVVGLAASPASAQMLVELEARYWLPDLDASMKVDDDSLPGTDIDLEEDLGLDGEEAPEGRLTIRTGVVSRLRLAYTRLRFEADETLSRTIRFGGETFAAGQTVASEVEMHYGRVGWLWQPLTIPGLLRFGPLFEVKGFWVEASIETRGAGPTASETERFPLALPTVGLALDLSPHPMIHLFAEASGVPLGDLGHVVDAEAGLRLTPLPLLAISAGYRIFDVRIGEDDDDDMAELTLFGPFVGASLRF